MTGRTWLTTTTALHSAVVRASEASVFLGSVGVTGRRQKLRSVETEHA